MADGMSSEFSGTKALAAIVFTDVAGFSQRSQADEATTLASLHRDIGIMASVCSRFNGVILKTLGDGVLMRFSSAQSALDAAIEIQVTIFRQSQALRPNEILEHRIGIHLGDVIVTRDDVMGDGVNIAARLQAIAKPGAICLSRTVYDVAKANPKLQAKYLGPRTLKGIKEPVMVWEIPPIQDTAKARKEAALDAFSTPTTRDPEGSTGVRAALVLGVLVLVLIGGALAMTFMFKKTEQAEIANKSRQTTVHKGPTLLDRLRHTDDSNNQMPTGQPATQTGSTGSPVGGASANSQPGISGQSPSPDLLATLKPLFDSCQFKQMASTLQASPYGQTFNGIKMANDDGAIDEVITWLKVALAKTSATTPILVANLPNTTQSIQVYQDSGGKIVLNLPVSPVSMPFEQLPKAAISAIASAASTNPLTQADAPANLQTSMKAMMDQASLFNEN